MTNENNPNLTEMIREIHDGVAREMYCKGVDDFLKKIQWEYLNGCEIEQSEIEFLIYVSSQIAEQLKAGVKNERY